MTDLFYKFSLLISLTLSLTGATSLAAEETPFNPALADDRIMTPKSTDKINEMARELHQKTGMQVYYAVIHSLKNGQTIIDYEKELTADLKGPFALIALAGLDKKTDLFLSPELAGKIDKDDILNRYMIPILVEKRSDVTVELRYEAAVFNGITRLIFDMAALKGLKLESVPDNIDQSSKKFDLNRSMFLYGFAAFILISVFLILKHKRQAK
jgi:hypothetical protein